ncbi:MAG: hypothetical protein HQL87_12140 [Magnetococcales bacterium]|nr:hypothetical protein [Magnetococcales bacterium]
MLRRLFSSVVLAFLLAAPGAADELYRCAGEGEPPRFFPKQACQLAPDPTVPPHPIPTLDAVPSPPPVVQTPLPSAGPWTVTQLFFAEADAAGHGGQREAIVNRLRVGIGALVDGGRVREITRNTVIMAHAGGETVVPFDRETMADGSGQQTVSVALDELDINQPHLLFLLQQMAAGKEVLLLNKGVPLARLLPIPTENQ